MTQVQITDQDRKLLDFIAKGEAARGGDPYASVFPSKIIPEITTMSLNQLLEFQLHRTSSRRNGGLGLESSAAGRFQFIRSTLFGAFKNSAGKDIRAPAESYINKGPAPRGTTFFEGVWHQSGLPISTRYTPSCQDFLILLRLKNTRQLNQWKSGSITDQAFCLNLAKEFASIPVPFTVRGAERTVNPGQSFYAGVGSNRAVGHANISVILQELADIRGGGAGTSVTIDIEQGSGAFPAGGRSIYNQTERSATGGQSLWGAGPTARGAPNTELPGVSDPYVYKPIDPLDNRYDFRTGEIVRDLLHNGVNPVDASTFMFGNGLAPINDLGVERFTSEQFQGAVESRSLVGYSEGQIDPGLNEGARRATASPATNVTTVQRPRFDQTNPRGF
jgi:hypothetical protein